MKQDARPERDDGGERAELRALLREWSVPEAPAAIEDALRREIRRRRPRPRVALWLPLAACLGLLAAWPLLAPRRGASPAAAPGPRAAARSVAPAAPKLELAAPPPAHSVSARPAVVRRVAHPRPKELVVVERAQARLLAEFGRRAWETPQAGEAAGVPGLNGGAEAPAYRGEWEEVAGEWPVVQVVAPMDGR